MHRYTLQELENIFKDKTLGKEIIPFIKNNKIQQDVWLEKYQDKWKLIQTQLSHGLLCPICGTILFKFYSFGPPSILDLYNNSAQNSTDSIL